MESKLVSDDDAAADGILSDFDFDQPLDDSDEDADYEPPARRARARGK